MPRPPAWMYHPRGSGSAFTFGFMGELLDNYVRLRDRGITPFFCVNHGPTTSRYYRDPDGNRVELQIDNFATAKEGQDWMLSPAFDRNPVGVEYDPDALVERFRSGVPVAELVVRDERSASEGRATARVRSSTTGPT